MHKQLKEFGEIHNERDFIVFFGNHKLSRQKFTELFPHHYNLHQVHSDLVIAATPVLSKADGHFTNQPHKPLLIKTADCMPVFFKQGQKVIGVHIGWRGLAQKILSKAVVSKETLSTLYVGPCISQNSFQLDKRSAESLLKPHRLTISSALELGIAKKSIDRKEHYFIALQEILKREAKILGFKDFSFSKTDTFSSLIHYSHRRFPIQKKRNLSFILKKT